MSITAYNKLFILPRNTHTSSRCNESQVKMKPVSSSNSTCNESITTLTSNDQVNTSDCNIDSSLTPTVDGKLCQHKTSYKDKSNESYRHSTVRAGHITASMSDNYHHTTNYPSSRDANDSNDFYISSNLTHGKRKNIDNYYSHDSSTSSLSSSSSSSSPPSGICINQLKNNEPDQRHVTFSSSKYSLRKRFIWTVVFPILLLISFLCFLSVLLFVTYNRSHHSRSHSNVSPHHQRFNLTGFKKSIFPSPQSTNDDYSRDKFNGKQMNRPVHRKKHKSHDETMTTVSSSDDEQNQQSRGSNSNFFSSESRESEISFDPSTSPSDRRHRHHPHHHHHHHHKSKKAEMTGASPSSEENNGINKAPNTIASPKTGEFPLVETKNGLIEGFRSKPLGRNVLNFLGIPYAEPPIGELRFQKPQGITEWKNLTNLTNSSNGKGNVSNIDTVLFAKNFGPPCIQFIPSKIKLTPWISKNVANASEDCLYLNIWVPEDTNDDSFLKTVMVWIHGGAYFSGSSDLELYNGDVLASIGDVIVVSLNYRLGALGFLSTIYDDLSGNMGMYDQVVALQWIKENIEFFGGDPENIVLFGQSAGATSAGLHMFSPLTKDIPSRLILQSGSPLFPKIYYENSLEKSSQFAVETGCGSLLVANGNISHVIDCLRALPIDKIVKAHEPLFQLYKIPFFPHAGDEFLPELPHDMIYEPSSIGSQNEILLGNNEDEGSFFLHLFFPDIFTNDESNINQSQVFNLTVNELQAYITQAYSFIPQNQASTMSQFFLASASTTKDQSKIIKATHDIIGDSGFVCPAVVFSELLSEYNVTVYHYLMNGRPSNSQWNAWMGTTHLDEVPFIFGSPLRYPHQYTTDEVTFSRNLIDIWTHFAKTGRVINNTNDSSSNNNISPVSSKISTWPPFTKDSPKYLEINANNFTVKSAPHKLSCNLWKIIYDSFL